MGEFGLRWILAVLGVLILAAIYLWGMRARWRETLRERRRRAKALSLEGQPGLAQDYPEVPAPNIRDFPDMSPDHHLADKMLVDVEITPVKHPRSEPKEAPAAKPKPVEEPEPKPVDPEPSLESSEILSSEAAPVETLRESTPTSTPAPAEKKEKIERTEEIRKKKPESAPEIPQEQAPKVTETPTKTIALTVVAPEGRPYRGPSILLAAQALQLKLHKSGVFDYFSKDQESRQPIFSVAHLREPGTFDLDTVGHLVTPGLLMYMQLPGPVSAVKGVESILEVAKQLTQRLGGTVCTERRQKLTLQNQLQLKGEAADFDRRLQQARQ